MRYPLFVVYRSALLGASLLFIATLGLAGGAGRAALFAQRLMAVGRTK